MNSSERVADLLAHARQQGSIPSALSELRATLTESLTDLLSTWVGGQVVASAVATATEDWKATRQDYPHRGQHPLADASHGHQIIATLPFVPEAEDERTEREARDAARSWAARAHLSSLEQEEGGLGYFGDDVGPPPARVGILHLLNQGIWWCMRDPDAGEVTEGQRVPTVPIRLEDMTHDHRLGLLGFLRRNAPQYKIREDWYYASISGPSGEMAQDAFEAECDRQWNTPAAEWIEDQVLVKALVYWTTPYAESPLTWRPIKEASRNCDTLIIGRWSDLDDQEDMLITWTNKDGWTPADATGYGGFDDDPDQFRELRDDECCPHNIPFIVSELTLQRIAYCRWCDHGHEPGEDCERCREGIRRMDEW